MASNPWKTVHQNVIYKNKYGYTLYDDDVITPSGGSGKYMVLECKPYVAIVALTPSQEVVLVRHWRYPVNSEFLEIPAGGIDERETPQDAAIRELSEETGYTAQNWQLLSEYWLGNGAIKCKGYIFLATNAIKDHAAHTESTESIKVETMPLTQALHKISTNEFNEDRTITGLLLAQNMLRLQP